MKLDEMMEEMRDVNINYLMLAQSMIQHDKTTAVFRLGISQDVADLIEALTPAQILKLAASGMLVSRFRFDDGVPPAFSYSMESSPCSLLTRLSAPT